MCSICCGSVSWSCPAAYAASSCIPRLRREARTPDDRTPDQGREVPGDQEPPLSWFAAQTTAGQRISFDFKVIASLNKVLTMELARCAFVDRRENVIMPEACLRHDALGPSGTGKTHVALGLGLAACQKGQKVRFTTAAAPIHELIEAADERRLQRLQKLLVSQDLLIIDELGFVPLSKSGAELLFEVISQRYERGSIIITSNLPFDDGPRSSARNASQAQFWTA